MEVAFTSKTEETVLRTSELHMVALLSSISANETTSRQLPALLYTVPVLGQRKNWRSSGSFIAEWFSQYPPLGTG